MPFAIPPHTIFQLLDVSVPKLILGSKESNPSAWRVLTDLFSGKTNRPQKRTLDALLALSVGRNAPPLSELTKEWTGGLPWETLVTGVTSGRKRAETAYDPSTDIFRVEAIRMERLAYTAMQEAKKANDLSVALEHISRWNLCDLPSLQWVIGNIDTRDLDRFGATASPLVITASLYLMACWNVESLDADPPDNTPSITPQRRDGQYIRPMSRWLETLKQGYGFKTQRELANFLLRPRSTNEEPKDLEREVRKWRATGAIPAWSRVPHIINSVVEHEGEDRREQIHNSLYGVFAMIRLMDKLLTLSQEIQRRWLPDYDPLAPFQDMPLIRERAVAAKAALLPQAER